MASGSGYPVHLRHKLLQRHAKTLTEMYRFQVSILPTFYAHLFTMKVKREAFCTCSLGLNVFDTRNIGKNAACKMLVKLTACLNYRNSTKILACFIDGKNMQQTYFLGHSWTSGFTGKMDCFLEQFRISGKQIKFGILSIVPFLIVQYNPLIVITLGIKRMMTVAVNGILNMWSQ